MISTTRQLPIDSKHVLGDLLVTSLLVTSGDHPSYLILLLYGASQERGRERERLRKVGFGGHTHDHSTQTKGSESEASLYQIARPHLKTKDCTGATEHKHTWRPTLLLWILILAWMSRGASLESRKSRENFSPKSMSWLQPPHSHVSWGPGLGPEPEIGLDCECGKLLPRDSA